MTSDLPQFLPPPPRTPPETTPPGPPDSPSSMVPSSGQPVVRWGMGDVLIGLLLWLVGGIIASIVVVATSGGLSTTKLTNLSLGALVVSLVAGWPGFLGWPAIASWFKGQQSLVKDFGLSIAAVDIGWGVLGGVLALSLSIVAGIFWRLISDSPEPSNADFLPSNPSALTAFALLFLVAVCTPVVEELFFRGLFLRAVGRRFGLPWAVVASSIVFGLLHFQGAGLHGLFISGVTATYGAVFAVLVVRAGGRLGPSIIAHAVVNGVGVIGALYLG